MSLSDLRRAAVPPANEEGPLQAVASAELLLESVDTGQDQAEVVLTSGRRYAMEAEPDGDRLTIRSGNGRLILCVLVTEYGPVLAFEGAELQLRGMRSLLLDSDDIEVRARTLRTRIEGDVTERIGGGRHTHIHAADRLEAAVIQTQASHGPVELRAAGRVAIDAEHIGLNDDPCPAPFGWTEIASDQQKENHR